MIEQAAEIIRSAEGFVITAGAGMGVDSGLPDFRGDQGFWNAYPMYARLGLSFVDCANPEHFERDPSFGWGFYGHRTNLYRETTPHEGFNIIKCWIERNHAGYFVVTSNVDGQFQKAGYSDDRIVEVHGSIHHLQCSTPCCRNIWENNEQILINTDTMRARSIPRCPYCRDVSRPNILMFGDCSWLSERTSEQRGRFKSFRENNRGKRIVVIEMGAGRAIPTIRYTSEELGEAPNTTVIRINPRESEIDAPHISLEYGALEGLKEIDLQLR
jgi:NAD-dependent SIR2 family protein deacetylase